MLLEIKARAKHAACQASSITVEPHNADVGDQVINLAFRFQRQRPYEDVLVPALAGRALRRGCA